MCLIIRGVLLCDSGALSRWIDPITSPGIKSRRRHFCPSQPPLLALSCRTHPHKENMASTPTGPKGQKHSQSVVADEDTPMAEARAASPLPSEAPDVVEVTRPPAKKARMTPKRTTQTLAELLYHSVVASVLMPRHDRVHQPDNGTTSPIQ